MRSHRLAHALRGDGSPPAASLRALATDPVTLALVGIGLVFRVVYALAAALPNNIGDQVQYKQLAADFGGWWSSANAIRTPGYPFFLGGSYDLGLNDEAVLAVQSIALTVACLLMAIAAGRIAGVRAARAAALIGAIFPPLITLPSMILADALAASLLAATIFLVAESRLHPLAHRWLAGASFCLTAAILTRPNVIIVVPVIGAAVLLMIPRRRWATAVVAMIVPAVLLFGPWIARNYAVLGEPAPLSQSDSGRLMAAGVHLPIDDDTSGRFGAYYRSANFFGPDRPPGESLAVNQANTVEPWPELWENVRERPVDQVQAMWFWFKEMWLVPFDEHAQYARDPVIPYLLTSLIHFAVVALALWGTWRARRNATVRLIGATVVIMTLPFLFIPSEPRYATPALLLLFVPAGVAADATLAALPRLRRRLRARPSPAG